MARIKIEDCLEHMKPDIRSALGIAVEKAIPGSQADRSELYREFIRAIRRKCQTWESVPDRLVETD